MKRPGESDSFAQGLALMLLWSWPLGTVGLLLWVGHMVAGLPALLWRGVTVIWLLQALVRCALIDWGSRASARRDPPRENKNPYSYQEAAPAAPEESPSLSEAELKETMTRLEQRLTDREEKAPEEPGETLQQGG